jgi:transcription factor CON7
VCILHFSSWPFLIARARNFFFYLEFKELRKQWRKAKKDEEADRSHSGHDGHGLRRSSMRRDRILDADLHPYPHHRYISHHPYHTSHHSSHALSALSSSLSVPSLGPDGRYAAVPIEDVRYPPDDLDGMPRGHRAEDAFRRGSYPDLRAQARCHGSAPGSWYPGMAAAASRPSGSHYPLHGHSSSHLNLSTGLPTNADISLNRLGPESTLLTPLRDYESTSLVVSSGLNMYGGYAGAVYSDDDARPDTGHGSLYDDARPHTGQGSIYDDRPSTGHGSVYDDRPSTGNGSLYSDERPGTGHRSLYDDGRPGTGHGSDRGEFRHP